MGFLNRFKASYYRSISDKRKYPRVAISVKVTNLGSGTFTFLHASNISVGGMFLRAEDPMPKGTRLLLKFVLLDKDEIQVEARVVRIQMPGAGVEIPSGMGLEFTKVSPEAVRAISLFVDKKM